MGESIGYHVKGWVSVLSGHRKSIPYRSNYKPFVYFILENNVEFFKDAKNRESEHGVPANLWRAISNGRKPLVETFEIIQSLEDGKIVSSTGVDRSDLKDVIFYRGPRRYDSWTGRYNRSISDR